MMLRKGALIRFKVMKMKHNIISILLVGFLGAGLLSCSNEEPAPAHEGVGDALPMQFSFSYPEATRVGDTAFDSGDKVGLFMTLEDAPLEIAGNAINNECLTYNGSAWQPTHNLFWDAGRYNAYAYFPYLNSVSSVADLPFAVATDQSTAAGYAASDFLYASAAGLTASANPVSMKFRHIMSKLTIRLIKGEDYEGDLPTTATVLLHNTVTSATIDLAVGIATRETKGAKQTVTARQVSPTTYAAITVPQRIDNRVPLLEVIMNGVSFLYESKFQFKPGTNHLVNLVIDKNPEQVKIEIGGEITSWN